MMMRTTATATASFAPLVARQQQSSSPAAAHCKSVHQCSSRIVSHHRRTRTSTPDVRRLHCYRKEAVTVYEGEKDTWEDPNDKPDFWEGERWDLFGQILSKLYIFAIVVAVGAAGYAASTYSGSTEQQAKDYAIEMAQSMLDEEGGEEESSVLPIEEE